MEAKHEEPEEIKRLFDPQLKPFYHGVASGDPLKDAVIIWTRVTPDNREKVNVNWAIATDKAMMKVVKSGEYITSSEKDFTVKIDVKGLEPGTTYYYQFEALGAKSIVGRTKTVPQGKVEQLSFAFASCSNYEWGYFNGYAHMALDDDLNAVVHLGDYIYEYAPGGYGDTTIGRIAYPKNEITTIEDYRFRYSQYKTDEDLMKAHQMHPFITIWDDHELANNAYVEGAQNHNPEKGEGIWDARKNWARKVYYEWMPVRDDNDLYRAFRFGDLVNLVMLDTRIAGRTEQVDDMEATNYQDPERTILGKQQYNWLVSELKSDQQWQIIGNQVPFGPMIDDHEQGKERYMDGWDGYPVERAKLISEIQAKEIDNIIWMTGDYHSSFAFETDLNATADVADNIGVEFVVPSINSANTNEYDDDERTQAIEMKFLEFNPHLRYVNLRDHGYVKLVVRHNSARASFIHTEHPKIRSTKFKVDQELEVISGNPELK